MKITNLIKRLLLILPIIFLVACCTDSADDTNPFSPHGTIDNEYTYNELEANNNAYQSQEIDVSGIIYGDIGYNDDDSDWFRLTFSSNGIIQLTLHNYHSVDTDNGDIGQARLMSGDDLTILSTWGSRFDRETRPGETAESPRIVVSAQHTYYIKISHKSGEAAPYSLEMSFTGTSLSDQSEPNNNNYEAAGYEFGLIATIGYNANNHVDEMDYYQIIPPHNGVLVFQITNNQASGVEYGDIGACYLYDESLSRLAQWGSRFDRETTPGAIAQSDNIVVSGDQRYYIAITHKTNHAAPYELNVYWVN